MNSVLVVDDKELMRDSVAGTLRRAGLDVAAAASGASALEAVARRRPGAVVTDLKMPGMTGLELLEQVKSIDDELPVIVMTAFGAVETAVQAMKAGAFDYITKPFEGDELIIAVKRAMEHARVMRENAVLRRGGAGVPMVGGGEPEGAGGRPSSSGRDGESSGRALDRIVGVSPAMRRVKEQLLAVAESQGTVLICGESGTGKEVVARAAHELSPRSSEPFLALNCAALSESLLESELFGHEKGAFTGAERLRKGRFELADRGTLLLDEISEVSTRIQAKLLRVLQERSFERVGSSLTIGVDVRIIATSNRDLPKVVNRGDFRQDLFFRLNVLPIHLPPLRDRGEDIVLLAEHFLRATAEREGRKPRAISDDARQCLLSYEWPGNVRELQNICERAAVLCKEESICRTLIEPWLFAGGSVAAVDSSTAGASGATGHAAVAIEQKPAVRVTVRPMDQRKLEDIEREAIVGSLVFHNGHRVKAARSLGIGVRTLGLKLKKWKEQNLVDQAL